MSGAWLPREKRLRHPGLSIRLVSVVLHLVVHSSRLEGLRGFLRLCLRKVKHILRILGSCAFVALLCLERVLLVLLLLLV